MIVDRAWIAARIPHAGTMCLLDRVLEWDAVSYTHLTLPTNREV